MHPLLDQTQAKGKFGSLLAATLDVIAMVVPPPDGYEKPFIARSLAGAGEFCANVAELIERVILEKLGCEQQALRILAAVVRGARPARMRELERALPLLALVPGLLPDVFLVLRNLGDKSWLRRSLILSIFKRADQGMFRQLIGLIHDGPKHYRIAQDQPIRTLSGLAAVANRSAAEFWARDSGKAVVNFLTQCRHSVPTETVLKLAEICTELLSVLRLPHEATHSTRPNRR
jgi:hypothetical protein